jgi:hypothetical protein
VPSCAEALAKSLENLASADSPDAAELQSKLHAIYLRHCNEDKWPIAVLRCYASTTGMSAMKLCRGKLPPDQIAKLQAEVMGVMSGGAQPAARSSGPVPVGGPPAAPRN